MAEPEGSSGGTNIHKSSSTAVVIGWLVVGSVGSAVKGLGEAKVIEEGGDLVEFCLFCLGLVDLVRRVGPGSFALFAAL